MHKKSFWRGYAAGLALVLGLASTGYYVFLHQPDISLAEMGLLTLDGRPVPANQLAGRRVVVNYWATWCGPCIAEFPVFEQVKKATAPDMIYLMVSDEPAAVIQGFLRKHPFSFRFLRVRQPLPGVNSRPVTYVYDSDGALVAKDMGSIEDPARLRELVQTQ